MGGVKFLNPELGDLARAIDHCGLTDSGWADQEKGGMGSFL